MKNNKGITLTSLMITIIILIILAGVTITVGYDVVERAELENLKTNMLLVQAKTKVALEEYNFGKDETKLIGTKVESNSDIIGKLNNIGISEKDDWYYLEQTDFNNMNLSDVYPGDNEYFLVKYDKEDLEVEILYTKGYKNKYTLTELQNME